MSSVIPVTRKLASQWLSCQASGITGSVLGLVGLMSVCCDWVRLEIWSATCKMEQICPRDTLICCWEGNQQISSPFGEGNQQITSPFGEGNQQITSPLVVVVGGNQQVSSPFWEGNQQISPLFFTGYLPSCFLYKGVNCICCCEPGKFLIHSREL